MNTKLIKLWAAMPLALMPNAAMAASNGISFSSTVTHSCTINVTQSGTLDTRNNYTRLTSRSGPGIPGRATVVATGNTFVLSVDAPTAFDSQPAADTTPETFRAWHRSNGATSYGTTRNPRTLNDGTSNIRIHMDARKSSGDIFEAGNYSATVVLRCE